MVFSPQDICRYDGSYHEAVFTFVTWFFWDKRHMVPTPCGMQEVLVGDYLIKVGGCWWPCPAGTFRSLYTRTAEGGYAVRDFNTDEHRSACL